MKERLEKGTKHQTGGLAEAPARFHEVVKRFSFVHKVASLDSGWVFSVRQILKHAANIFNQGKWKKGQWILEQPPLNNLPCYCTACTLLQKQIHVEDEVI